MRTLLSGISYLFMFDWLQSDTQVQAITLFRLVDYSETCLGGVIFVDLLA